MENASKALLIAGGMLLTMIIIALLLLLSNSLNSATQAQEDKNYQEELVMFNKQFEAYNKQLLYGVEVITVINKAIDNNLKGTNIVDIRIQLAYAGITRNGATLNQGAPGHTLRGSTQMQTFFANVNEKYPGGFAYNGYFTCSEVQYTEGRVSYMEFIQTRID